MPEEQPENQPSTRERDNDNTDNERAGEYIPRPRGPRNRGRVYSVREGDKPPQDADVLEPYDPMPQPIYQAGHIPNHREDYGQEQRVDPNWRYFETPNEQEIPDHIRRRLERRTARQARRNQQQENPQRNPQAPQGDQPRAAYGTGDSTVPSAHRGSHWFWDFPWWWLMEQTQTQPYAEHGRDSGGSSSQSPRYEYGSSQQYPPPEYQRGPQYQPQDNPQYQQQQQTGSSESGNHFHYHSAPNAHSNSNQGEADMRYDTEGKVCIENVFKPESDGGGGRGGVDQMGLLTALLADRSRSNEGGKSGGEHMMGLLTALLADRSRDNGNRGWGPGYGDGFGFGGGGGLGALLAIALLGRGGFGGFDHHGHGPACVNNCNPRDRDHDNDPLSIVALQALNSIQSAIPTVALQTQNQICEQTGSLALGIQQGFSNTKDSVQALGFALAGQLNNINQNVSDQGCDTRATVLAAQNAIISKIDGNRISELETQLAGLRHHQHTRDSEINIRQEVNTIQAQAQAQQQQQLQWQRQDDRISHLFTVLGGIANQVNIARANQDIVNLGTMTASGTQVPTNVNQR